MTAYFLECIVCINCVWCTYSVSIATSLCTCTVLRVDTDDNLYVTSWFKSHYDTACQGNTPPRQLLV